MGELGWKLDPNQEGMYEFYKANIDKARKHVWNCSRQLGKSYLLCCVLIEDAMKNPGWSLKYAAQTAKQVRSIVRPHFRDILADCPPHLRPTFHVADGEWRFPNGSVITVAGCDNENAEKLRGQHAHRFVVDEGGAIDALEYVIQDIALPQTINTRGRLLVASTPAKSPGHYFKTLCDEAEDKGTLLERTIYDNPRITEADIEELKRDSGGEESTTWQREYLVRHVTDQDRAVLKAATESRLRKLTLEIDPANPLAYRPESFDAYVGIDVGWSPDCTGIVWGYWDYEKATLVIENEFFMRQLDTKSLAAVLRMIEVDLWGEQAPFQRWADLAGGHGRLQADLASDHDIIVLSTPKDDKDAAINRLNLMIAGQKYQLRIHPRCKLLKRQMKDAIWNKQHTKFERTKNDGHFDLVDALIYMARNIAYESPPQRYGQRNHTRNVLVIPDESRMNRAAKAIAAAFGIDV
jgi:hypothetical protein